MGYGAEGIEAWRGARYLLNANPKFTAGGGVKMPVHLVESFGSLSRNRAV